MKTRWHVHNPDPTLVEPIARECRCHRAVAGALVNRNILDPEAAHRFLNPSFDHFRSPFRLKDMERAVERIVAAIRQGEHICVYGDYDVDGISAVALVTEFLEEAGARTCSLVPHRAGDGYGFHERHVGELVRRQVRLVITVDCGVSSHKSVDKANEAGIDVIVTDHHHPPSPLPRALAVVDPKRPDCPSGLQNLAGVGVAFCLLVCLRAALRHEGLWTGGAEPNLRRKCDLVALGTIADMVPLTEENRILTRTGLQVLGSDPHPGIKVLMEVSGIRQGRIDETDVAFRLAPRLNAAGRLADARSALDLLRARDMDTARNLAVQLDALNRRRQEIEQEHLDGILEGFRQDPSVLAGTCLVLDSPAWHPGVIGIVASRLARRFCRPVVLISRADGWGKGSARSIPGFDLYQGLVSCTGSLEAFGGHASAAGIVIRQERIPSFRRDFDAAVKNGTRPEDFVPRLPVDGPLDLDAVDAALADQIEAMGPFGEGNREPVFCASHVTVASSSVVGKGHQRMDWTHGTGDQMRRLQAIWFRSEQQHHVPETLERAAFRVRWNRWNGKKQIQLIVEGI